MNKIAFIDRDGTLIYEPEETKLVDSVEKLKILPDVIAGLKKLQQNNYKLIMITNQDGLGTASFPQKNFDLVQKKLLTDFKKKNIEFAQILICPHFPKDNCSCRKPKINLTQNLTWQEAIMIGDRDSDKKFAQNLNIPFIKMQTNSQFPRFEIISRKTNETNINLALNLDGSGEYKINSGLNFFNHMLEQFSLNSLIDLNITSKGDLKTDEHHTIEDIGLCLGQAIKQALGNKKNLQRYGFLLPMDESLAQVALDLGGRSYLVLDYKPTREYVGDLPTELIRDFFQAFCNSCECNLNIKIKGRNEHHKIEAMFKAFGQTMKMALTQEPRLKNRLPSTKGKI